MLLEHGDPEKLQIQQIARPVVTPGHVVIRVRASSFNDHDVFTVQSMPGIKVPFPVMIGLDITLTNDQMARLCSVSQSVLNFPADNNRDLAPHLAFAGATVGGVKTKALPMLATSIHRY